jgi:hypothetical protein
MYEIELDHMRLIKRKPKEIAKFLKSTQADPPTQVHATVLHEADDSCCAREPWLKTLHFLLENQNKKTLVVLL